MRFQVAEIRQSQAIVQNEDIQPDLLIKDPPHFISLHRPLQTHIEAKMTEGNVLVSGKINTTISLECARCLEKLDRPYEVSFQQVFPSDVKEIDVSNDVRESILIDLPFKALCREDCRGLCTVCGKNQNKGACGCSSKTDPRWDSLKQFPFK